MKSRVLFLAASLLALSLGHALGSDSAAARSSAPAEETAAVPVLYCTDLFHPHDDPDDHFDLATIFAMPELDLKGIILDQGGKQLQRPGRIPVSQMNHLTGRRVPAVLGLEQKLSSPTDQARDQKPEFQKGVELILAALRNSSVPVNIVTVGSVRDVVAAFSREPALFRTKVGKLLVFIGEASEPGFQEYNVELDCQAYIGLMRSGLPVFWVPCFDGGLWQNNGHASFWQARHEDLLRSAAPPLIQYFIYALEKENSDPLAFLAAPVDSRRQARLFAGTRNLWCAAIFGVLSGRKVAFDGTNYVSLRVNSDAAHSQKAYGDLFGFSEVDLSITDQAVIRYGKSKDSKRVLRFHVLDKARYAEGMTAVTAGLLSNLAARK